MLLGNLRLVFEYSNARIYSSRVQGCCILLYERETTSYSNANSLSIQTLTHSSHHTRKFSSPRKLADPDLKDLMTKLWNLTSFISKDFMCIGPCYVLSSGLLVPRRVTKAKTMFVFRLCHLRAVCRVLAKSVFKSVFKDSPEILAMVSSEP